ncbi:MAG: hypothetical protein QOJ64_3072 [Acidobacteriota bacterium]|jgi:hypothetical protein|nr:hypothetical protein [Acidobacteriota bacterium]
MNCQLCRTEIEELEPGARLSDAARAHVDACLLCGAFYDERLSLRKLMGSLDPVAAPADFDFRLRARLAAAGNGGNHRFSFRSFIASAPALALAASFALLVAAVVLYNQFKPQSIASPPAVAGGEKAPQGAEPVVTPTVPTSAPESATAQTSSSGESAGPGPSRMAPAGVTARQTVASANREGRRVKPSDDGATQIETHEEAVRPAPQIRALPGAQFSSTSNNPLVELPVRSSSQPVRVFLDDRSGGRRSVTLEPVIFGSQDLTGRVGFHPASSQGIW